jgi:hypothetical protein
MIHTIPREAIVETLLNSLEAERYMRGPLLLNVIDELTASGRCDRALEAARELLATLEQRTLSDAEFGRMVSDLRACVRELPASGTRLKSPGETLARAARSPAVPPVVVSAA